MTKTQQIAAGLRKLGWTIDTNHRSTKGTVWSDASAARIFQSNAGTCRMSPTGKKIDSLPMSEGRIAKIIAAGAAT